MIFFILFDVCTKTEHLDLIITCFRPNYHEEWKLDPFQQLMSYVLSYDLYATLCDLIKLASVVKMGYVLAWETNNHHHEHFGGR